MRNIEGNDKMYGVAIHLIKIVKRPYGRLCVRKVDLANTDWLSHESDICASAV